MDFEQSSYIMNIIEQIQTLSQVQNEQNLTDFNKRVQRLLAVTGKSQGEIAALLDVSRTTLYNYCTGQNEPKASAWFRLEQAEQQWQAETGTTLGEPQREPLADRPLPEEPTLFADERSRTEIELARHLHWLQGARLRQQEVALAAQRHLHEIEGWVHETEAELTRVRELGLRGTKEGGRAEAGVKLAAGKRPLAARKEKRAHLRDIDTVSLPIFGALPAGWPQTREGVLEQRPARKVRVARGRFPEGSFGLDVRGDSMNAARPTPILDRDTVVLLPPELRTPRHDDIVAALIDGDTCLKRLKMLKKGAFLRSESTNPNHGEIHPTHDLVIQGVFVGKL